MFTKMIGTTFGKVTFIATLFVALTVSSFIFYIIPRVSESLIAEKKYTLHEMSNLLIATLHNINARVISGEINEQEARTLAMSIVRDYRYGKNGDDYFWVNNLDNGIIFIHPYDNIRGTNITDLTDETGFNFGSIMLDMARRGEEGYVKYMWIPKPGRTDGTAVPKLSHIAVFEPWGWAIGTGIYIDDVEKELFAIFTRIFAILVIVLFSLIGLLVFIIRIGSKIENQKNLIRTEFVTLIQHMPIGMFRICIDHIEPPLLWNKALIDLLEIPDQKYLQKPDFNLLSFIVDQKNIKKIKETLLKKGELSGLELQIRTFMGKTLWVKVYGKTFSGRDGLYFDASVENITEKILSQKNLEHSYTELKKIDHMKDEIISITSHELRTPITIIKGFASILANQTFGILNETQKLYANKIINNANRLLEMITNMLDLEKLDSDKMPFDIQNISINELLEKICDDFQLRCNIEKRSLELQTLKNDLIIHTDPTHLKRVLVNLIDNAIKYTHAEIGKIRVFAKQTSPGKIEIHVQDNGIGIAFADQKDIFKKFKQVGGHMERVAGGSGLGLPIAKKLIHRLGGTITVSSEIHKGSDFYITIPVHFTH